MHLLSAVQPCCRPIRHTRISGSIESLSVARPLAARRSQRLCTTIVESSAMPCRRWLSSLWRYKGGLWLLGGGVQLNQRDTGCGLRSGCFLLSTVLVFIVSFVLCFWALGKTWRRKLRRPPLPRGRSCQTCANSSK